MTYYQDQDDSALLVYRPKFPKHLSQFPKAMNSPVLFLHIPKTAGTAVVRHLETHIPEPQRYPIYEGTALDRDFQPLLSRESPKALYGHFYWQPIFRQEGLYSFTFLRKPQYREVSNYLFLRSSSNPEHRRWCKEWRHFGDYLQSKQALNHQTRMLSGMGQFAYFRDHQQEALERAKENLGSFDRIGFQEEFYRSFSAISQDLGWAQPARQRHNSGPQKYRARWLLLRYQKALKRVTQLDQELYAYAHALEHQRR